eukprot:Selendium_serpulae@DN731_c0_g1_i1.p1
MLERVLKMDKLPVSRVMCPRVGVSAIDRGASVAELLRLANEKGISRVPIYDDSVDNIVAVVKIRKALMRLVGIGQSEIVRMKIKDLIDPKIDKPFYISAATDLWDALHLMRAQREHMAVVVDEHGGTAGVVTMEDLLEQVVGEIYDETDAEPAREAAEEMVSWDPWARRYELKGHAELPYAWEVMGLPFSDPMLEKCSSISGFLCRILRRIPAVGDTAEYKGFVFNVTRTDAKVVLDATARHKGHGLPSADGPRRRGATASKEPHEADKDDDHGWRSGSAAQEVARLEQTAPRRRAAAAAAPTDGGRLAGRGTAATSAPPRTDDSAGRRGVLSTAAAWRGPLVPTDND